MTLHIHDSVIGQLCVLKAVLPQAILLTGASGVGLKTIALDIANAYRLQAVIQPELLTKTSSIPLIGIDAIRSLYATTRTKSDIPSVVILDDADKMTREAQNSLLKLLEEPNSSTHFILTSHEPETLLATVRSRLQTLHFPNISTQQTQSVIDSICTVETTKLRQLLFIADGRVAEITRLLADDVYFYQTVTTMVAAKKLIEASQYDRIQMILTVKTDKLYIFDLLRRSIELLSRSPTVDSLRLIEKLFIAQDAITKNGNVRLHLTSAVV